MKKFLPPVVLFVAVLAVLVSLRAPRNAGEYNFVGFGRLPILVNGRVKPLDTVARTSLLVLQGRQRAKAPDGRSVSPEEWLLDVLYRPEIADTYQTFEIVHPDVLAMLNLTPEDGAGKKRFSFHQLAPGLAELDRQSKLADNVESAARSAFQRAVIQLRDGVVLYQRLQSSLVAPGVDHYLDRIAAFEQTVPAGLAALAAQREGKPHDAGAAKTLHELGETFSNLESIAYLLPIPPLDGRNAASGWLNAGASLPGTCMVR